MWAATAPACCVSQGKCFCTQIALVERKPMLLTCTAVRKYTRQPNKQTPGRYNIKGTESISAPNIQLPGASIHAVNGGHCCCDPSLDFSNRVRMRLLSRLNAQVVEATLTLLEILGCVYVASGHLKYCCPDVITRVRTSPCSRTLRAPAQLAPSLWKYVTVCGEHAADK